jgi:predicted RNA methylase
MLKQTLYRRAYGQFFTPRAVVAHCYELLMGLLPPTPRLLDPACGDGAFLRFAIAQSVTERHLAYGSEIDADLVASLRADGLQVLHTDGLDPAGLPADSFDVVVGNPPFGITTSRSEPHTPSEVQFLLRALELVRPGGYITLVLPSGVLANESLRWVRADVLRRCTVMAVVSLPRTAFRKTGANAVCSVVVLRKAEAPPKHRAFFAIASRLSDLPAIAMSFHNHQSLAQPTMFWLPQSAALAQRLDPAFWNPARQRVLDAMAERFPLRPLGELIGRASLIVGDHVRPSRGEAKGPNLPYEYYQTREFLPTGYNYSMIEHCDERAYRRLARTAVQQHDILVSCAGVGGAGRGRVCLVTHRPGPSCTGDIVIVRTQRIAPHFLFQFLSSRGGREQLLRLQNGVGTANLSADELLQVQVPLLPSALEHELAAGYAEVTAAHDTAMAALRMGDQAQYVRVRQHAERLLAERIAALEALLGLDVS